MSGYLPEVDGWGFGVQTALQDRLEAAQQTAQQTPPRVREAEARLQSERARIEALLAENAALSMRAQQLQEAAALQDFPLPLTAVSPCHSFNIPSRQRALKSATVPTMCLLGTQIFSSEALLSLGCGGYVAVAAVACWLGEGLRSCITQLGFLASRNLGSRCGSRPFWRGTGREMRWSTETSSAWCARTSVSRHFSLT